MTAVARTMRAVGRGLAWLLAVLFVFLLAAVAGALIPVNAGWAEADDGVTVRLTGSAAHTELVLPVRAAGVDLGELSPARDLRVPRATATHLSFGWGERDFVLTTPTLAELRLDRAVGALLLGGNTVMHVTHLPDAGGGRAIRLTVSQYRALAAAIAGSFARDGAGQVRPIAGRGYGDFDAFYVGTGRYTPWNTCNQWTRDRLAAAGVRVGVWTPLPQGLTWRFKEQGSAR